MRDFVLCIASIIALATTSLAQERYRLSVDPATAFSDLAGVPAAGLFSLLGPSADRLGGMLVVQDTKDLPGVVRPNSGLGIVVVTKSAGPQYTEIATRAGESSRHPTLQSGGSAPRGAHGP